MAEGGKYAYSSLVMGLNLLVFFFGFIFFQIYDDMSENEFTIFFIAFYIAFIFLISSLSYLNQSPIGGVIIGLSFSISFWVGFLTDQYIKYTIGNNLIEEGFYVIYILFVTTAFSAFGLFFGLLGYISNRLLVENPVSETFVFRDYWSNVYALGKNARREFSNLDQKLTRARSFVKDWRSQQIQALTQSKPELVYVNQKKEREVNASQSMNWKVGDVYDITSGQRIYEEVINPRDLTGVYKPSILNIPATSNRIGGASRLAFEELISRFLGWLINTKILWAPYLVASAVLTISLHQYFTNVKDFQGVDSIVIASLVLSMITIYLVHIFHNLSLGIFNKRPDVRTLLFTIYLILLLFYGLYYQVIIRTNQTVKYYLEILQTESYVALAPWTITIEWMGLFTIVLALAYIFVHRESEVSNIYLYDGKRNPDKESPITPFKNEGDEPYWLKNDGTSLYWVLRYMYFWPYELTLIPHPDWERIEVWVDAKTGEASWIVSDYHYRELWYKVEGDLKDKGLHVGILANFHTPIPFVTNEEVDLFTNIFNQSKKALLRILVSGKMEIGEAKKPIYHKHHPPEWVEKFGLKGLTADFCSNLNWCYWRYPWGIDNFSKYITYPSTVIDEQPKY